MCSSLNVFGLHKIVGSSTVRRCDLVQGSVVLLEEAGVTHAFNKDFEDRGHTFNLGDTCVPL